ncbi:DegT/DnrJ/EryC1/StrS family aminotransferase [Campylobacter sp. 2457A]|uniref:DegT/DnrJ/EryC1/StrS family aminotransferase n=1 Tax=Campylobacter sp. 2457A TaxID=2735784 RepID=UPI00301CF084|nr:DegT/DnrJ/EryC1/StrS family aminotransferase [Campylobacter sp. 2457A]
MNSLEEKISNHFNTLETLYTGSGTSALFLIFKYLKSKNKNKVLIPSLICPQVVSVALKAGVEVIFADVSLDDYTLIFESCKKNYDENPYDALVLVHLYGHFCDEKIIDFCKDKNIFIIEDCAQTYQINPKCDLSILSFGHTKFLENDLWGGAILSSKISLNSLRDFNKELTLRVDKQKFEEYRLKYYSLNPKDENYFKNLKNLLLDYTFVFGSDNNPYLEEKLSKLSNICEKRKENMQIYQNFLKHELILHPKFNLNSISWRYTFRYLGDREKLLENLRKNGIDCSSWYLPSHLIFGGKTQKNSEILSKELINLWCDEKISKDQIKDSIKIILSLL